jgi:hypothetical protein
VNGRPSAILVLCALVAAVAAAWGCSRRGAGAGAEAAKAAEVDCNSTAGAPACPPDTSDPTGQRLPRHGALCTLKTCKPCGSASAPAFRDFGGAPRAGYCICVPKSDDSGLATYSCFTKDEWAARAGAR